MVQRRSIASMHARLTTMMFTHVLLLVVANALSPSIKVNLPLPEDCNLEGGRKTKWGDVIEFHYAGHVIDPDTGDATKVPSTPEPVPRAFVCECQLHCPLLGARACMCTSLF